MKHRTPPTSLPTEKQGVNCNRRQFLTKSTLTLGTALLVPITLPKLRQNMGVGLLPKLPKTLPRKSSPAELRKAFQWQFDCIKEQSPFVLAFDTTKTIQELYRYGYVYAHRYERFVDYYQNKDNFQLELWYRYRQDRPLTLRMERLDTLLLLSDAIKEDILIRICPSELDLSSKRISAVIPLSELIQVAQQLDNPLLHFAEPRNNRQMDMPPFHIRQERLDEIIQQYRLIPDHKQEWILADNNWMSWWHHTHNYPILERIT